MQIEKKKNYDEQSGQIMINILGKWWNANHELEEIKVSVASLHLTVQYYQLLSLVAHENYCNLCDNSDTRLKGVITQPPPPTTLSA